MRWIYDASAIVNLASAGGPRVVDRLKEGSVLDLTFYEIGNSIWKLHTLLKKLSQEEARSLLMVSLQLTTRLDIIKFDVDDAAQIEELANKAKCSFYDGAYLYAAKKNGHSLITDDRRLAENAAKQKTVVESSSFLFRVQ